MFGLAGLYEVAHDAEGRELKTFTIITTSPNKFMTAIHDRMPVIIHKAKINSWLDNSHFNQTELLAMLVPYQGEMEKWRASTRVNSVTNQGKDLKTDNIASVTTSEAVPLVSFRIHAKTRLLIVMNGAETYGTGCYRAFDFNIALIVLS